MISSVRVGVVALSLLMAAAGGCGRANEGGQGAAPGGAGPEGAPAVAAAAAAVAAVRVPVEGAPAAGVATAPVTIVAFNDYECPFCRRADGLLAELRAEYGERLRVVARQKPLPFHENARPAALAALAAAEQGKFWAMHERLFGAQEGLGGDAIERAAREAGLDLRRFRAAMGSQAVLDALERDEALSRSLSVRGTPTFFVNGRALTGARSPEEFRAVINEELARAEAALKKGVKPAELYAKLVAEAPAPPAAPEGEGGDCGCGDKDKGGECPGAGAADKAGGECQGGAAAPGGADAPVEEVQLGDAPLRGPADAPVTVVVFSDFECPFCAKAERTLAELEKQYAGKLRVAYKSRPLPFHKHAKLAAKAALAADEQGKFWAYHDALLANQRELERPALERLARELGLRLARFDAALDSDRAEARLQADIGEADRLKVAGTPTFFINGRRLVGAQPVEAFRAVIDKELERAGR
ncbi:MAG TPA: thioredoxin domain-containing protein [Polyangiaceae bacterium]|nr:thioredoxin domain-containing protein [Polyangiaceae bacterium]